MAKDSFVFKGEDFCIPVTKAEPLKEIDFIIKDFVVKKLTFCLVRREELWETWRLRIEGDTDKIYKEGAPTKPDILFVEGIEVADFKVV